MSTIHPPTTARAVDVTLQYAGIAFTSILYAQSADIWARGLSFLGYEAGTATRLLFFCYHSGLLNPQVRQNCGFRSCWMDFLAWVFHDQPDGPPFITAESLLSTFCFFAPGMWAGLAPDSFWRVVIQVFQPLITFALPWLACALLPKSAAFVAKTTLAWYASEPQYVTLYGLLAYMFAWRGSWWALHAYILACITLAIFWSRLSSRDRIILRNVFSAPWLVVAALPILSFGPVWMCWTRMKVPCLWIRHKIQADLHSIVRRPSFGPRNDILELPDENKYRYRTLGARSIRLLEVSRDPKTRELFCSIRHARLDDNPVYDAISYTWGKQSPTYDIKIDGKWLQVGKNAYDILQDRASFFETRTIWIDRICINQDDNAEKDIQVPMMSEIYSRSNRTIICLGKSPAAELAFSLLLEIIKLPERMDLDSHINEVMLPSRAMSARLEAGVSLWRAVVAIHDARYSALAEVIQHDYFSRVWIVQEVVFSRSCHIRWGDCWISWGDFARAINIICDPRYRVAAGRYQLDQFLESILAIGQVASLALFKDQESLRSQLGLQRPPLCQFLTEIWGTRATDPRDIVFGLVNLTRDADSPDFAPNYGDESDPVEFYPEICRRFLRRGELKSVLYVSGVGYPRALNALPSWVPDWTCTPEVAPLKFRDYNASARTEDHIEGSLPREISIRGIIFDTISAATSRCFPGVRTDRRDGLGSKFISLCATLMEALRMTEPLPQRYSAGNINQSKTDAFWRTMVGDAVQAQYDHGQEQVLLSQGASTPWHLTRFNRPIPDEYAAVFETWGRFLLSPQIEALVARHVLPDALLSQPSFEEVLSRDRDLQELYEAIASSAEDILLCAGGRKFAITSKGYMAVVPPLADVDDEISVLYGLEVPFALRTDHCHRVGSGKVYNLVGEAYFHGFMDGEAICDAPVEMEEMLRIV